MPQINEYLPQVEAQGPVGGTSPNLEAVGAVGRGMEHFAQSLEGLSDVVYKKTEQKEVADSYSLFAKARADWNQELNTRLGNNTLDADKFKQEYQDFVDKNSQNITTPGGKNFFDRQAARLGGSLLTTAAKGQVIVDTNLAMGQRKEDLKNDTNSLFDNPSGLNFVDILDKNGEKLAADLEAGTLKAKDAPMVKAFTERELANAFLMGTARTGEDGPQRAMRMLRDGAMNDYLNADQRKKAEVDIEKQERLNNQESAYAEKAVKKAEDVATEAILQKALPDIVSGKMTPKQIMALPIKESIKEHLLLKQEHYNDEKYKPNHELQNDVYQKIIAPDGDPDKIQTTDQLLAYRGPHGERLNLNDIKELSRDLDKYSPQGKQLNSDRKSTNKVLTAGILTTGMPSVENGFSNKPSAAAQTQLQQATQDLKRMEDQFAKDGKDIHSLHDPGSKDYFATPARMAKYRLNAAEVMKAKADQIRIGTSGTATGPAFGQKKDPDAYDPAVDKSIQDWKKRTGR